MRKNILIWGALGIITVAYCCFILSYFVPGIVSGNDQNAYHAFGRTIIEDGRFARVLDDDLQAIGAMWVTNDRGEFFPKYPPGYPALSGVANYFFGAGAGFYLAVAGAVLSIPAIYCTGRFFLPQLFALLTAWMLALTPVIAFQGISRTSHTPSLAFFLWGMASFLGAAHSRKYRYSIPLAMLGGLLIGFCTGIRYTDFLLIAIPGIYALCYFRGKRFWLLGGALGLGAAIPYAAIGYFHYWAFGSPFLNGYALTGEASAFQLNSLMLNIRLYLPDILRDGVGPAAVLMFALFLRPGGIRWKRTAFWSVWILPTLCLYLTYYWAPDGRSTSYLRFLVPLLPAFYILGAGGLRLILRKRSPRCIFWTIAGVALLQLVWGLPGIFNTCEPRSLDNRKLAQNVEFANANLPEGAVVVTSMPLAEDLDFWRRYTLYPITLMNVGHINRSAEQTIRGEAIWLQRSRAEELQRKFGKMKQYELNKFFVERFKELLKSGKRVFFYAGVGDARRLRGIYQFYFELKEHGKSPAEVPGEVFVAVNIGSHRYGEIKKNRPAPVMELWELVGVREKGFSETEREMVLQDERNELVRQIGDDGAERSQSLARLESVQAELNYLRWNRTQRENTAKAKAEAEKRAKQARDKAQAEKRAKAQAEAK